MQNRAAGIASILAADDLAMTGLARPVVAGVDLLYGVLDVDQVGRQRRRQRLGLASLGGHLARIGEVRVVGQAYAAITQLFQLRRRERPLRFEFLAQRACRTCLHRGQCSPWRGSRDVPKTTCVQPADLVRPPPFPVVARARGWAEL